MGNNATSLAIVRLSDNRVQTFVKLDVPEEWIVPSGYQVIPNDELPQNWEYVIETHNMDDVRLERNKKLQDSDWTQLVDSQVNKIEWATYRQALRDIPQNYNGTGPIPWPLPPNN